MSEPTPAQVAQLDQIIASAACQVDAFVESCRTRPAHLTHEDSLVGLARVLSFSMTHVAAADVAAVAVHRLAVNELAAAERYRLAWQHARQRAADHLAALVESDEERDFLRAQLKERDDEVAQLVARLAEYTGITS